MKIIGLNNIFFQKKLVAKCAVKKGTQNEQCSIYKLDSIDDIYYFDDIAKTSEWQRPYFLTSIMYRLGNDIASNDYINYYAIENSDNKCLGYCRVDDSIDKFSSLTHLEVMSDASHNNPERKYKYIGETLVAFLAKKAKCLKKESVKVPNMSMSAMKFYLDKCKFLTRDFINFSSSELPFERFEELETQNAKHTGQTIEIMD